MSYCFKKDVTKPQTIKMKVDRMGRKENPLGWAPPQQSIKGNLTGELYSESTTVHNLKSSESEL
ncbi:hypothetical protein T05_3319 [Trichinella murrelli]|uniref:Uncharacterized protein n=1 Tax=Trichinella murrelli TaxID=144512 RepID=A0A0V0TNV9_9BILA|nr:hypothetical protein T05_3319 [Trichinella murrelli]